MKIEEKSIQGFNFIYPTDYECEKQIATVYKVSKYYD